MSSKLLLTNVDRSTALTHLVLLRAFPVSTFDVRVLKRFVFFFGDRANVARRKEQQRSFFAEMEGNIRTKIGQGVLFGGATPPSMPSTPAGERFSLSIAPVSQPSQPVRRDRQPTTAVGLALCAQDVCDARWKRRVVFYDRRKRFRGVYPRLHVVEDFGRCDLCVCQSMCRGTV